MLSITAGDNKLNGAFICYMTSCLKMAIRCLLFDENYNTETHEKMFTELLEVWQLHVDNGIDSKTLEVIGTQIGAVATKGKVPSVAALNLMVAKHTAPSGDSGTMTAEQKAQADAALKAMDSSSIELLSTFKKIAAPARRTTKKKAK
ncbi:hypothetical protein BJ508DRAFT_323221 [Ascobolus immersus RN42]|uniref:Uncharacterized protein n=1 Tax=Ascobolus immersus RN42 TaxID=1160509 RepID=A0A3N4ITW6_ASCIM|nr:hypothetical protein BJ508DRAFT_323221 [Ascobolus immersus RN42]